MNNDICQFFVIFGKKNFTPPVNNNAYINATNINNVKELSDKILNTYKEKARLGIKVGSEIVFLIPDEKYRLKTEEIIKQLKVNGKIEVMNQEKTKIQEIVSAPLPFTLTKESFENNVEKVITNVDSTITSNQEPNIPKLENNVETPKVEEKKEEVTEAKVEEKSQIYQPSNNIYRGTVDSNTYTNFKKPNKTNNLAVIIFIISFIFFVISLILLFVM